MIAALALTALGVSAQHAVGSLTIQPKVGLSLADLIKADGSDLRVGAVFGAELEYQMDDLVGISVGALYSMQGAKGSESIEGVKADETIKLDYINVPIMANFYVARNFAFKVGIQPGFNVSHKVKANAAGMSVEADIPGVKTLDFSIPLGLSYEYNNFVLDARYNIGLTNWIDDVKSKNSVIHITLGYKFDL